MGCFVAVVGCFVVVVGCFVVFVGFFVVVGHSFCCTNKIIIFFATKIFLQWIFVSVKVAFVDSEMAWKCSEQHSGIVVAPVVVPSSDEYLKNEKVDGLSDC